MIRRWTRNRLTPIELGLILTLLAILVLEMAAPFVR